MSYPTAHPHIASYAVVTNKDGHIAFVLRSNTDWMNDHYGLPSGKVEKNESFIQAAIREAKEEIGIDIKAKDIEHCLTVHRFEPSSFAKDWVDVYYKIKNWIGEPHNAEPHIHSEIAWLDPKNLPLNIIPSVKFALEQINTGNNYAEYGWESTSDQPAKS